MEKAIASSAPAAEIEVLRASLQERVRSLISELEPLLENENLEQTPAGDPEQVKKTVEQLSRYLADSDATAIEYFETATPHLRILFGEQRFEHFAGLVHSYAFPEAYEELMAAGKAICANSGVAQSQEIQKIDR